MGTKTVQVVKEVVVSPSNRGKTLNLPHVEHVGNDLGAKNSVYFDPVSGEALVSPEQAEALVEFYTSAIVRTGSKKKVEFEVPVPDEEEASE